MGTELIEKIKQAVIAGKRKDAAALCEQGLKAGLKAKEMVTQGLLPGMQEVGTKFRAGEYFIPEVLVAARAMQTGLDLLKVELTKDPAPRIGKVVIGTVSGDLHDIGKNLVAIMLTGAGFEVIDMGIDVSKEKFTTAAKDNGAQAVAMSALLTTTMVNMKDVIEELRKNGFKGKVIIGGAPVTQEFAEKIGADLYGADAAEGADKLRKALAA